MERQMNQPMLTQELFAQEILKKLFNIPYTNKKSMVLNTLLIVFPFILLILGADLIFVRPIVNIPATIEVLVKEERNSTEAKMIVHGIIKVVWLLLGLEILFVALFCAGSLFSLVAVDLNLKDLLGKRGGSKMRGAITWLYVTCFVVCVNVFVMILMGLLSMRHADIAALIVLCIMIVTMGTLCYVYLAAVWIFGMVMSIHEMHVNQSTVLDDKIVEGRRIQGFVLMLLSSVFSFAIVVSCAFLARKDDRRFVTNSGIVIVMHLYVLVLKLLMFGIYSMRFYLCNREDEEEFEASEFARQVN